MNYCVLIACILTFSCSHVYGTPGVCGSTIEDAGWPFGASLSDEGHWWPRSCMNMRCEESPKMERPCRWNSNASLRTLCGPQHCYELCLSASWCTHFAVSKYDGDYLLPGTKANCMLYAKCELGEKHSMYDTYYLSDGSRTQLNQISSRSVHCLKPLEKKRCVTPTIKVCDWNKDPNLRTLCPMGTCQRHCANSASCKYFAVSTYDGDPRKGGEHNCILYDHCDSMEDHNNYILFPGDSLCSFQNIALPSVVPYTAPPPRPFWRCASSASQVLCAAGSECKREECQILCENAGANCSYFSMDILGGDPAEVKSRCTGYASCETLVLDVGQSLYSHDRGCETTEQFGGCPQKRCLQTESNNEKVCAWNSDPALDTRCTLRTCHDHCMNNVGCISYAWSQYDGGPIENCYLFFDECAEAPPHDMYIQYRMPEKGGCPLFKSGEGCEGKRCAPGSGNAHTVCSLPIHKTRCDKDFNIHEFPCQWNSDPSLRSLCTLEACENKCKQSPICNFFSVSTYDPDIWGGQHNCYLFETCDTVEDHDNYITFPGSAPCDLDTCELHCGLNSWCHHYSMEAYTGHSIFQDGQGSCKLYETCDSFCRPKFSHTDQKRCTEAGEIARPCAWNKDESLSTVCPLESCEQSCLKARNCKFFSVSTYDGDPLKGNSHNCRLYETCDNPEDHNNYITFTQTNDPQGCAGTYGQYDESYATMKYCRPENIIQRKKRCSEEANTNIRVCAWNSDKAKDTTCTYADCSLACQLNASCFFFSMSTYAGDFPEKEGKHNCILFQTCHEIADHAKYDTFNVQDDARPSCPLSGPTGAKDFSTVLMPLFPDISIDPTSCSGKRCVLGSIFADTLLSACTDCDFVLVPSESLNPAGLEGLPRTGGLTPGHLFAAVSGKEAFQVSNVSLSELLLFVQEETLWTGDRHPQFSRNFQVLFNQYRDAQLHWWPWGQGCSHRTSQLAQYMIVGGPQRLFQKFGGITLRLSEDVVADMVSKELQRQSNPTASWFTWNEEKHARLCGTINKPVKEASGLCAISYADTLSTCLSFQILFTTETLGKLLPVDSSGADCRPAQVEENPASCYGGSARRAGYFDSIRKQFPGSVIAVDPANHFFGGPFFYEYAGSAAGVIKGLEGYDTLALSSSGDFYLRNNSLRTVFNFLENYDSSAIMSTVHIPQLSNLVDKYHIVELANGGKIGIVSVASIQFLEKVSMDPTGVEVDPMSFRNGEGELQILSIGLQAVVNEIRRFHSVDYVVVLSSTSRGAGNQMPEKIAYFVSGIDVIIHYKVRHVRTVCGLQHPTVEYIRSSAMCSIPSRVDPGKSIMLVALEALGKSVGHFAVDFDLRYKEATYSFDDVFLDDNVPEVANLWEKVKHFDEVTQKSFASTIFTTPKEIEYDDAWVRGLDTPVTRFVLDAFMDFCGDCDFALLNAGAIRDKLPAGNVSQQSALNILPFNNELQVLEMEGRYVKEMLKWGITQCPLGGFPSIGGLRLAVNHVTPPQEIAPIGICTVVTYASAQVCAGTYTSLGQCDDWRAIQNSQIYKFATTTWLASGQDGYTMIPPNSRLSPGHGSPPEARVLAEYLKKSPPLNYPTMDEVLRDCTKNKEKEGWDTHCRIIYSEVRPDNDVLGICQDGYKFDQDSGECNECELGKRSSYDSKACVPCEKGTYSDIAGVSACARCPAGTFMDDIGAASCRECIVGAVTRKDGMESCVSCEQGGFSNVTGMSDCYKCMAGKFANVSGSSFCHACPIGAVSREDGMESCVSCETGRVSNFTGMSDCHKCIAGKFANVSGSSFCHECPIGAVTRQDGLDSCTVCDLGRFTERVGTARCDPCPIGKYNDRLGQGACKQCADGSRSQDLYVTLHMVHHNGKNDFVPFSGATAESFCGCMGTTRPQSEHSLECVACGEGLDCLGKDEVFVLQGYSSEKEVSVYKCLGNDKRCQGGRPGFTCSAGRTGISCFECEDEYYPENDGTCSKCAGQDLTPFIIFNIAGFGLLCVVYHIIDTKDHTKQSHSLLFAGLAMSMAITVLQQLGVVSLLSLDWPEPLASTLSIIRLVNFNIEILKLACIASTTPVSRFTTKALMIGVVGLAMLLIHIAFVIIRYRGDFKARMPSLIGCVGTVFTVFYISVASTVMAPVQCMNNPNGMMTVQSYQSIVCWGSDEHTSMVVVAAFATLMPITFLAWCTRTVLNFPVRMRRGDLIFLRSYAFLFFRYRVDTYWYALFHLVRSLFVALAPVIPQIAAQILTIQFVMIVQLYTLVHVKPWRILRINDLEAAFTVVILILLSIAGLVSDDLTPEPLAIFAMVIIVSALLLVPLCVALSLCRWWKQKAQKPFMFFICHHKVAAGGLARLLKMYLKESPRMTKRVFVDSDDLQDLDKLFNYVGEETDTFVILMSKEILMRPWCIGEMVTCKLRDVHAVPVILADFVPPSDEFLANYEVYVPGITVLTTHGINLPMVLDTIPWIVAQQSETLPSPLTHQDVFVFCDTLFGTVAERNSGRNSGGKRSKSSVGDGTKSLNIPATEAGILVELDDAAALCTALVLSKLLFKHLVNTPSKIPAVLEERHPCVSLEIVLIICTNGTFHSDQVLITLLAIGKLGKVKQIPILADESFRFPTSTFVEHHKQVVAHLHDDPEGLLDLVVSVFQSIALVFQPENYASTEEVLETKAVELTSRMKKADILQVLVYKEKTSLHNVLPDPKATVDPNLWRSLSHGNDPREVFTDAPVKVHSGKSASPDEHLGPPFDGEISEEFMSLGLRPTPVKSWSNLQQMDQGVNYVTE